MSTIREAAPEYELVPPGETPRETYARRKRNRVRRAEWERRYNARCAQCGLVRFHVSHEMDPDTAPEGPEYHRGWPHHAFVEPAP